FHKTQAAKTTTSNQSTSTPNDQLPRPNSQRNKRAMKSQIHLSILKTFSSKLLSQVIEGTATSTCWVRFHQKSSSSKTSRAVWVAFCAAKPASALLAGRFFSSARAIGAKEVPAVTITRDQRRKRLMAAVHSRRKG